MDTQRLRNLTTGKLHTKMADIYQDIEFLTGIDGIMTHMIPNAMEALNPYLMDKVEDMRFWNDVYDKTHLGSFDIEPMNEEERKRFMNIYNKKPNPLEGKKAIVVAV